MKDIDKIMTLREQIKAVSASHGAHQVYLFGSMATGESRVDSDVDLLIDMEDGRSLLDLLSLRNALNKIIGRPVDVVTRGSLNRHLRDKVLAEAIPL